MSPKIVVTIPVKKDAARSPTKCARFAGFPFLTCVPSPKWRMAQGGQADPAGLYLLSRFCFCLMERKWLITVTPTKLGIIYVSPIFGSRKRVADALGNLPEQLAVSFDGHLVILHFDK